jgi:DNA-binding transcriptional MerR regulator
MKKYYKINQAAKLIGVSVKTLQRWDKLGILKASRTLTNRRIYTEEQLDTIIKKEK